MTLNLKSRLGLLITSLFTMLFIGNVSASGVDLDGTKFTQGILNGNQTTDGTFTTVNTTLLQILGFARGAGVVVCVIMLVWCAIQLAMSSGNNQKRQMAMEGIKNVLIAVAVIGAATLICSLAYGLLK